MNDNAKKVGLIIVVIVALAGAVWGAMRFFGEEKMEVGNTVKMPEGYKSEKQRFLDEQAAGQQPTGQAPAEPSKGDAGARDLGGDLRGGG